jgi:hypothetical protein
MIRNEHPIASRYITLGNDTRVKYTTTPHTTRCMIRHIPLHQSKESDFEVELTENACIALLHADAGAIVNV